MGFNCSTPSLALIEITLSERSPALYFVAVVTLQTRHRVSLTSPETAVKLNQDFLKHDVNLTALSYKQNS